jgi:hypothetical protein
MAYCVEADVVPLLGDLELASTLSIQTFIDRASVEIDLALGNRYIVPVDTDDYFTTMLLKTVNAELAASQIFLSQASGGEDNRVNAYGMLLFNRANERLRDYLADKLLPGATPRDEESAGSLGPAAIYQEDEESLFANFNRLTQSPGIFSWGYQSDHRS